MRMKAIVSFLALFLLTADSAWAQARVYTVDAPSSIENPLGGFEVSYTLGGTKFGVGAASAMLRFYISSSPDGSTGAWLLDVKQILLSGNGLGLYYPPAGKQTSYIAWFSMPANTVAALESMAAACQPQTWYILAQLDSTAPVSDQTLIGTTKLPDFYFSGER